LGYTYLRRVTLADGAYLATFRAPSAERQLRSAAAVRDAVQRARCR